MKRITSSIMALVTALHINAVPANQRPFVYTQPDGRQFTLTLVGDEHAHTYRDSQGYAVTIGDDGFVVRLAEKAETLLKAKRIEAINEKRMLTAGLRNSFRPAPGKDTRGLIILVNFDDLKFNNTKKEIHKQMNDEGYSKNGATGSARDYFIAQSSGQFQPTFDVVGPVNLDMPYRYYGANDKKGSDKNSAVMIFSAVQKAANDGLVDLNDYDTDNDGIVDMVYIIYAGLGEADGGDANTVWPHMWNLQGSAMFANQRIQDKRLGLYACSAEYRTDRFADEGKSFSGIGTFCHEFGHCLGLPDIYDVSYSGGYGMGTYDIMSSGSYLNNGNTPPNYSAFERYSMGWLMYDDITTDRDITLSPISESNTAIRLSSPTSPNEYFILENRQQDGWDAYLPACGLMITHIDYDEEVWNNNTVNNDPNHQHVMMMAADNSWTTSTQSGDLYPGLLDNTSFTDTSIPNSLLWDGTPLNKPVTDIKMTEAGISFHMGVNATGISSVDFWHKADGRSFDIEGRELLTDRKQTGKSPLGITIVNGRKIIN